MSALPPIAGIGGASTQAFSSPFMSGALNHTDQTLKLARYSAPSLSSVRQAKCCPPSTAITVPVTLRAPAR